MNLRISSKLWIDKVIYGQVLEGFLFYDVKGGFLYAFNEPSNFYLIFV